MNSHSTETRQQVSMDRHETNHQANHQFRRLPKGERRVRFADSMGMELVSIFLFDLISNYYFASIHNHQKLPPPPPPPKGISIAKGTPESKQNPLIKHSPLAQQQQQQSQQKLLPPPALVQSQQRQQKSAPSKPQQQPNKIISSTILASSNHYHHNHHQQQQYQFHHNHLQQNHQQHLQVHSQQHHQPQPPTRLLSQDQHLVPSYVCDFTQPISLISFKERVKLNKVHLETCSVNSRAGNTSISCTMRVLNQSYDKLVTVRYTTDEWHTYTDVSATYMPASCDGWSDKFTTTFSVTNQVKQFQPSQRIIFCVRIIYDGDKVFWDNNGGLNYTLKRI